MRRGHAGDHVSRIVLVVPATPSSGLHDPIGGRVQIAELQEVCRLAAAAQVACDGLTETPAAPDAGEAPSEVTGGITVASATRAGVTMHAKVAVSPGWEGPSSPTAAGAATASARQAPDHAGSPAAPARVPKASEEAPAGDAAAGQHPQRGDAAAAVRGLLGLLHSCLQRRRDDAPEHDSADRVGSGEGDAVLTAQGVKELEMQVQQLLAERDALLDHIMEQQVLCTFTMRVFIIPLALIGLWYAM